MYYRESGPNAERFENIKGALLLYKQKHCPNEDTLQIPYKFVIPKGGEEGCDEWPSELWGMKIGARLKSIRLEKNFGAHREEFEAMGVNFEPLKQYKSFEVLLRALKTYKDIHGHLDIPYCYKVPLKEEDVTPGDAKEKDEHWDARWEDEMAGMPLGMRLYDVRYRGTFKERREELIGQAVS